jgi:dihydroorotase/N-acyl-D-amino-acid deacylase
MRTAKHAAALAPFLVAIAVLSPSKSPSAQAPSYDLLIRNGRIIDGTGGAWYGATSRSAAHRGEDRGAYRPRQRRSRYRCDGKVVAPGFIDIHSHARRGILEVPNAENYARQGVTTIIEGPDGSSPLPIKPHLDEVAAKQVTPNYGLFVGQGSIREAVMGPVDRRATAEELEKMRGLVRGHARWRIRPQLGSVLRSRPFTDRRVIELAKIAGQMGGIYISHMRDEASRVLDSVNETIAIGEKGHLPTQISHAKVVGVANWGRSVDMLRLVDEARTRGVDATIDQYPYTASSTSIAAALIPAWALEGGREATLKRLQNPSSRNELRNETARLIREERGGGDPNNVQLARCSWNTSFDGKRLGEVTKIHGLEPTIENAAETALWIVEQGGCSGIFHAIEEQDLQRILKHPATMVASDGASRSSGKAARIRATTAPFRGCSAATCAS